MPDTTKPTSAPNLAAILKVNAELAEALKALHEDNSPKNQNRALGLLLNRAILFTPAVVTPAAQKGGQTTVQIRLINAKDGRVFFPAFTDQEEMKKFIGEKPVQAITLRFDNFAAMLQKNDKASGLVVNPMGDSLTLDRDTVQKLFQQKQKAAAAAKAAKTVNPASISNPELVEALQAAQADNTPRNQGHVWDLILNKATFLAPAVVTKSKADGEASSKESAVIQFQMVKAQDGKTYFPACTDQDELKKLCGDTPHQTVLLRFDNYVKMLQRNENASGVIINPVAPPKSPSLTLSRENVQSLALAKQEVARKKAEAADEATQISVGAPAVVPEEMLKAVTELAAQREDIRTLWLRQMVQPGGNQSYLIVVEHTGKQEEVFQAITEAAAPRSGKLTVNLIPYGTGFAEAAVEGAEPFYQK